MVRRRLHAGHKAGLRQGRDRQAEGIQNKAEKAIGNDTDLIAYMDWGIEKISNVEETGKIPQEKFICHMDQDVTGKVEVHHMTYREEHGRLWPLKGRELHWT